MRETSNLRLSARALVLLGALAPALPACRGPEGPPAHPDTRQDGPRRTVEPLPPANEPAQREVEPNMESRIGKAEALEVARGDAMRAYRDLSLYDVAIELRDGNWQVDYVLRDPQAQGGGPHYVISGATGEILSKRYEQ